MKKNTKLQLKEKGWSEREIKHAESLLHRQAAHDVHFSKIVFWCALLVTIVGNIILSLILIPFLLILDNWIVYAIVILLALMMGFIYNFLVTDIGHLQLKHHLLAAIIIPCIALANIFIMVLASNKLLAHAELQTPVQSPGIIAILFALVFMIPYLVDQFLLKK
ncbi:MAG: hypothetical protein AABX37_06290 [Nanoarchaeota archaeon]